MTKLNHYKDIEEKLRQAAKLMPGPKGSLPLSPVMEERRKEEQKHDSCSLRTFLWRMPARRIAVIVLIVFAIGSTATITASSKLRAAIVNFFSSGTTEIVPVEELESEASLPVTDSAQSGMEASGELSGNVTRQTAGNLTLIQDVTLDSHFTASYVSSPDYLTLEETPSGTPLFLTRTEDGKPAYYSFADGNLKEVVLNTHTLTAFVQLKKLPGIMRIHGEGIEDNYKNLDLPRMEFTVNWQQYGKEILIDNTETEGRFDIGSRYGVSYGDNYDGDFSYRAFAGNEDWIEVVFHLDAQLTGYQYPFLLNLKTGEVSDPLASVDLSNWDCITELSIQDDLAAATAMAGSSHENLQEITIDLKTGAAASKTVSLEEVPVEDCFTAFHVGKDHLFYVTGTDLSGDGYLYNTKTKKSDVLFTDTAYAAVQWGGESANRYWKSIGYGYLVYYADDTVSLINLQDGGTMTVLEGIPMSPETDFFMNDMGTVLSISARSESSFDTVCLYLLDLKTMKTWSFDRDLPEGVEENTNYWNGEYGYVIEAKNTETGTNYIYLYQYTP